MPAVYAYTDVETIPTLDSAVRAEVAAKHAAPPAPAEVDPPSYNGQLVDPVKVAADKAKKDAAYEAAVMEAKAKHQALVDGAEAKVEEAIGKLCFRGASAHMIAMAIAPNGYDPVVFCPTDDTVVNEETIAGIEREQLIAYFDMLERMRVWAGMVPILVGHNIIGFDLKMIRQRAIILDVRIPGWFPRAPKDWSKEVNDTMVMWTGTSFRLSDDESRISQDALGKLLGFAGKGEITGADVWPLFKAGEYQRIGGYCGQDVRDVRDIHKRIVQIDEYWEPAPKPKPQPAAQPQQQSGLVAQVAADALATLNPNALIAGLAIDTTKPTVERFVDKDDVIPY